MSAASSSLIFCVKSPCAISFPKNLISCASSLIWVEMMLRSASSFILLERLPVVIPLSFAQASSTLRARRIAAR